MLLTGVRTNLPTESAVTDAATRRCRRGLPDDSGAPCRWYAASTASHRSSVNFRPHLTQTGRPASRSRSPHRPGAAARSCTRPCGPALLCSSGRRRASLRGLPIASRRGWRLLRPKRQNAGPVGPCSRSRSSVVTTIGMFPSQVWWPSSSFHSPCQNEENRGVHATAKPVCPRQPPCSMRSLSLNIHSILGPTIREPFKAEFHYAEADPLTVLVELHAAQGDVVSWVISETCSTTVPTSRAGQETSGCGRRSPVRVGRCT